VALHRLVSRWQHTQIHSSNSLICVLSVASYLFGIAAVRLLPILSCVLLPLVYLLHLAYNAPPPTQVTVLKSVYLTFVLSENVWYWGTNRRPQVRQHTRRAVLLCVLVVLAAPNIASREILLCTLDSFFKQSRLHCGFMCVSDFPGRPESGVASCWLARIFALCVPELRRTADGQLGDVPPIQVRYRPGRH